MKRYLTQDNIRLFLMSWAFIALTACAAPSQNYYIPPSGLTGQSVSTIVGSSVVTPNPVLPNAHMYIVAVDQKNTNIGWHDPTQPVLVSPGIHTLTIDDCLCSMLSNPTSGIVSITANFMAGTSYTLLGTSPTPVFLLIKWHALVWLVDDKGNQITSKMQVALNSAPVTMIFINH